MTINEIYNSGEIGTRSFNVCNDNGITDLYAILNHFRKYKTFDNLRNCGKKSNNELIKLSLKHIGWNSLPENEFITQESPILNVISNLDRNQRDIINSFIEINVNSLPVRSSNAIKSFLNNNLKIRNFKERILANDSFYAKKIKHVGAKSVIEIDHFIKNVTEFTEVVSKIVNEKDLFALKYRFLIQRTFPLSEIPIEIFESQSIFKLINFLISHDVLYEKQQNLIFQKALKIYYDQDVLTLDNLAEELNLSRERVRQIRKICLDELFDKIQFVKNIDDDLLQKYGIDNNQDFIDIKEMTLCLINEDNNTTFSKEFTSFLIYVYWSNEFELVGHLGDVFLSKYFNYRNRHNWNRFYIINKWIYNEFDFVAFADDLDKRLNDRIEETYSFNFKSYLAKFLRNNNFEILAPISSISEIIINDEFGLSIDLDDNIIFIRNTIKQVPEYAIEALEKLAKPSKIEDLYNHIEKEFPEITKSKDALRGSLQRTPEIIYFGRSSTYGLKKWEIEKEGIKGGTIKRIVFEYLLSNQDPIHIYQITNEVHKYRDGTNAKSIISNLKIDPQKRFLIFNKNFIGLSCKSYNSKLTNLPKFLGKNIVYYIRQSKSVHIDIVNQHFSELLDISQIDMNYIIQELVDNEFVLIDNQNNLYI